MKVSILMNLLHSYVFILAYAKLIKDFDYKSSIELNTYSNYAYTNYMLNYHGVIDHIFFDAKKFKFERCIPMPTHEEVTAFTALPSCIIPSDHLAVVVELEMIR
jgi:2',5'-phosphodiesterase